MKSDLDRRKRCPHLLRNRDHTREVGAPPAATFMFSVLPLLLVLVLVAGCGQDTSSRDDIAPSAPVWIPRYADDAYAQQGIRAEPVTDPRDHWVRLEWYANPEPDVVTYRVRRISETEPLSRRGSIVKDLRLGVDLEYGQSRYWWIDRGDNPDEGTRDNLAPDQTTGQSRGYYWTLEAFDSAGNGGWPVRAPRIYYRLLANPSQLSVAGDTSNNYSLSYVFMPNSNDDVPLYDMIRVYPLYYGPDSLVWAQLVHRYDTFANIPLTFARPLVRDCTYVCQINVICNRRNESHTDSLAGGAAFTSFPYH